MQGQKQLLIRSFWKTAYHRLEWANGRLRNATLRCGNKCTSQIVAAKTQNDGVMSIAGGGDTMAALANAGVSHQFSYVSTAGSAFEWLEGKRLPGVEALRKG